MFESCKRKSENSFVANRICTNCLIGFIVFNATYSNISAIMSTSFSGGRSRREPLTMGMQLVNFITCGCASSAPFFVIYKAGREPTSYW